MQHNYTERPQFKDRQYSVIITKAVTFLFLGCFRGGQNLHVSMKHKSKQNQHNSEDSGGINHERNKGIQKIRKGYKKGLHTLFSRGQSTFRSEKHVDASSKRFSEVHFGKFISVYLPKSDHGS